MSRPVILIDCDGVLADFCGAAEDLLQHALGFELYDRQQVFYHDIFNFYTVEQQRLFWRAVDDAPGWVSVMGRIHGALELVQQLRRLGELVAVTSPHDGPTWMPERMVWLYRLGFKKDDITFVGRRGKARVDGDMFIDDHPETLVSWRQRRPSGYTILRTDARYKAPLWGGMVSTSSEQLIDQVKTLLK